MKFELDNLDKAILKELQQNSRISFQEIARILDVSGGTIHVRVNKLKEAGVISGSKIIINHSSLGYDVCSFIGINLHNAYDHVDVLKKLNAMPEVVEAHYTTGSYSLFVKILVKKTSGLHNFLVNKLQKLSEIQSTETLISLDVAIDRDVSLD